MLDSENVVVKFRSISAIVMRVEVLIALNCIQYSECTVEEIIFQ